VKLKGCLLGAAAGLCLLGGTAPAPAADNDLPFALDGLPAEYVKHAQAVQKGLGSDTDPDTARGVYFASTVWPMTYRKLKVCFFGGTDEARSIVAEYALNWEGADHAMKLDFGKNGKFRTCKKDGKVEMQIRVGFDKKGYWSALGADSVVLVPQNEQSLNLNGFEKLTRATVKEGHVRTIRHEFGHALALMHEHQNPKSPCEEEFDWDKIYELLGGPPDEWPKEVVDFNMRKLEGPDVVASEFNGKSVMLYQFYPEFYKRGTKSPCYIATPNTDISGGDRTEIVNLYPVEESERVKRFEATKAAFIALWNKSGDEATRGVSFDAVKAYFERPDVSGEADDEE
jgi:hypothetical protein